MIITLSDNYRILVEKHNNHTLEVWKPEEEITSGKLAGQAVKAKWEFIGHYSSVESATKRAISHSATKGNETIDIESFLTRLKSTWEEFAQYEKKKRDEKRFRISETDINGLGKIEYK